MKRGAVVCLLLWPGVAHGYTLASAITTGCHELVTSAALRQARSDLDLPPLTPSRDQRAMIADLPFSPDPDLRDLAGVSLLLGARDNDLKGNDITNTIDLIQVHGNPAGQREHCLRAPEDDEPGGSLQALTACRGFIHDTALAALDGLDAAGRPDPTQVTPLTVALAIRGRTTIPLPTFYVKLGQAVHTLQDSFTHVFRTADGLRVTTVLNWVEYAEETLDEQRDGPAHMGELDACEDLDELRSLRLGLARRASLELMHALLDPGTRADKAAAVDAVLDRYLSFQPGCSFDNQWCDAPERALADTSGCACQVGGRRFGWGLAGVLMGVLALAALGRRRLAAGLGLVMLLGGSLRAEPEPDPDDTPPTTAEIAVLHDVKQPGPRLGIAASLALSVDRTALAGSLGGRFRLSSRWLVGGDLEWNPWFVLHPEGFRRGVFNAYGTVIRRYPMRFERVNLRTTLHLGMSVLLFDLYGARSGSVGPYLGIAPLGIDIALGHYWKLVFDPLDLEIPAPHITGVPLYYEQYRVLCGLQYGS